MPAIKYPKIKVGSTAKTGNPSSQSISLTGKFGKSNATLASSAIDNVHKGLASSADAILTAGNEAVANISAFESLTNISSQRPEIISLIPFQPLYEDSGESNVSGQLFDSLVEYMRALDSSSREFKSEFKSLIKSQNKTIKEESTRLRDVLKAFYDIYRSLAKVRRALTITNEYYDFSPTKLVNKTIKDDGDVDKAALLAYAAKMPEEMNVKNAIKILRYKDDQVENFSPTSAFVFLLSETRRVLSSHSYELELNKKRDPEKGMFSFPERSFYSFKKRLSMLDFATSDLNAADFNRLSDFTISEDLQVLLDGARETAEKLSEEELQIFEYVQEVLDSIEEGAALEANAVRLAELSLPLISEFGKHNKTFSSNLTLLGGIASIFRFISREITTSKKFNVDLLGSFGAQDTSILNYHSSIFGNLNANVDLYGRVNMKGNSIMELAQIPANANQKILLFEQTPGIAWAPSCKAGGDYFFDPELLVNFTNTNRLIATKQFKSENGTINIVSNSPDVAIKARIEELSKKVETATDDFFKCVTEMGVLVTKDEKVFDSEAPTFVSSNPEKYLENVWNAIKGHIAVPQDYEFGLKNHALGVKAMFAYAGSGVKESANVAGRIYLSILSEIYEQEIEDLKNLDTQLVLSFNRTSKSLDIPSDIKNTVLSVAYGIAAFFGITPSQSVYYDTSNFSLFEAVGNVRNKILAEATADNLGVSSADDILLGFYSQAGIIPCIFATRTEFGSAIRNDGLYKAIVSILKDLKKTLESYATDPLPTVETENETPVTPFAGTSRTRFNSASINSILYLMFWNICRMINATSPYIVRYAAINSFLGGFSGVVPAQLIQGSFIAEFLKDEGLVSNNVVVSQAVTMFVNVGPSINQWSYDFVKSAISQEMKLESMGILTVMNTLQVLNKNIKSTKDLFAKLETAEYANLIGYLGDPNKLSFLLKEPQLTLALSNIEDIYQSFQNFSQDVDSSPDDSKFFFTDYYDKLSHSGQMVGSLKRFFRSKEFRSHKGYNKKIISVGLAQDLLKNTLPKYDFQKQNDIIRLSIYKIDNLNSDIIYKPKSFLFEASRYPSRVYSDYKYELQSLQSIPTRNYSLTPDARSIDKGESAYWNDVSNSFGDEYSFLSQDEKEEIIENHAMSTLLENYIRIVTGLIINESVFNLTSDEAEALLKELDVQSNVGAFVKSAENRASNKIRPGSGGSSPAKLGNKLKIEKLNSVYAKGFATIAQTFIKSVTIPSKSFLSYVIQPKKFDRVFNIIFDPEFEVDVKKTRSTSAGDAALTRLINEGRIINSFSTGTSNFIGLVPKQYDEDKTPFDTSVESFFVVLESYDDKKDMNVNSAMLKNIPPSLVSKLSGPSLPAIEDALKKPMDSSFGKPKLFTPIDIGSILNKLK